MISLFLDSSSYHMIVGIYKDFNQLYLTIEQNDNHLSERLLPTIENAFHELKLSIKEINRIYVVNGPGSFTGVRIGVTIAKTLAWSLQIPVIQLSKLELMSQVDTEFDYIIPMIDARRDCVYAGIYTKEGDIFKKDQYISLEELRQIAPKKSLYLSDTELSIPSESKQFDISRLLMRHQNDTPISPHELKPNYLKITEAEANLNRDK